MNPTAAPRVGKQVVDIVTAGMYSDCLMVLREYIQNAADSIDEAVERGLLRPPEGLIEIVVDGERRAIAVTDNGVGVAPSNVERDLCSLGCSPKVGQKRRGFRGVGRLGGLGYCDQIEFETRSAGCKQVSCVSWDGRVLRESLRSNGEEKTADAAIRAAIRVGVRRPLLGEPPHFFRVTMRGVQRFHEDLLMNLHAIAAYLGRVAPVGFDTRRFPFANEIGAHLAGVEGYRCYKVRLNGCPILRPHERIIEFSQALVDEIRGVELFDVVGASGERIGRGWYARTGCYASLPSRMTMRGIRVRQGNIEVGDEYYLADSFTERRFAAWHIGEIHLGYSVRANARRDGFEQSPDYEALLEQTLVLGKHLSYLCRESSKNRSSRLTVERALRGVEKSIGQLFFVDTVHFSRTRTEVERILSKLEAARARGGCDTDFAKRLSRARRAFDELVSDPPYLATAIDGRTLRYVRPQELLLDIARTVVEDHCATASREDLLARIVMPYLKRQSAGTPPGCRR